MTTAQIAGLSVTAVLLAKLIQRHAAEQALMLTLLVGVMLTGTAVLTLMPVLRQVDSLMLNAGLHSDESARIGKAIGICCITQLASDICKDAGESAVATGVLLAGKAALLILVLPMIDPLLTLLREVMTCIG